MKLVKIEITSEGPVQGLFVDYILLKNAAEGTFGPEAEINFFSGGRLELYNTPEATTPGVVNIIGQIPGMHAKGIILVGIGKGYQLQYETLYEMCSNAIESIANEYLDCRILATVIHGAGFGLDKLEIFKTQLHGFKSGIENNQKSLKLEKIIFNEIGLHNANRLLTLLEELSAENNSFIVRKDNDYFIKIGSPGISSSRYEKQIKESKYVFVAMPFSPEFENAYDFGIRLPIEANKLLPVRTDKQYFTGLVIEEIKNRIRESSVVIADISTSNPNVLFELGFAQGCDKPVIILCRNGESLPFDVSGMNVIYYNPHLLRDLKTTMESALTVLIDQMEQSK